MSQTLSIVVSIFGLIGLGYAAARTRLLAKSVGEGLTDFVFKLAIPLLLFGTLAEAALQDLSPWRIWAAYFAPFAVVWAISHWIIRGIFARDARAAVVAGGSAAYSNALLIGVPLILAAFGEGGTIYLIIIIAVHLPVMMLASVALNEWATQADGIEAGQLSRREVMRRLAVKLATHPILMAIVAGLAWRLTGLTVPDAAMRIIDPLGRAAGPLALFASGMSLMEFGAARQIRPALLIATLKLLLMPLLVFGSATALELPPVGVAVLTLTAACPTGVNAFLIATALGTGQALASNALLMSTAGGVITVTLWLAILQRLTA